MEKNRSVFKNGEANEWFTRNIQTIENSGPSEIIDLLVKWLRPFGEELSNVLEIGCGSGHRLKQITKSLKIDGYGVDPSSLAINYINQFFPSLNAKVGLADDLPYNIKFDFVHLGHYLYLCDKEFFLRSVSEADRLLKFGGFLSIIDFDTPIPFSNEYSHKKGVYCHKQNYSDVFVASGLYSVINKYQFSHNNFYFDKKINERISLTLLYKETNIFKNTNNSSS